MIPSRTAAARHLTAVIRQGESLAQASFADPLSQELCYGVLRYFYRLQALANRLLLKPLKAKDTDVFCLILIGLYQLEYMRLPQYAAVTETVSACKKLKKDWARGLINKTLRRFIAEREQLVAAVIQDSLEAEYAHPMWLIKRVQTDWPDQWQSILLANNTRAPMTVRVNHQQGTRDAYQTQLQQAGIVAKPLSGFSQALQLEQPVPVEALPGFEQGACSVQDAAGQRVVQLLTLAPGLRVLDACAAPGSKTGHILEMEPNLAELVCLDVDAVRLDRIKQNLHRLRLDTDHVKFIHTDATNTDWWDGQLFDRILLDAPCSATGVIRRHPDIKLLRRDSDIVVLQQLQCELLNTLWKMLAPGGKLIYSTCSILKMENEQQISRFLLAHSQARRQEVKQPQFFPTVGGLDGFFFSVLLRVMTL